MGNLDWLRMLERDIWKVIPPNLYERFPRSRREKSRQLDGKEVARVLDTIEKADLIVDLYNDCMGFGLGMSVCAMPSFPGADPVFVMSMNSDHLIVPQGERRFDHAWGMLSPVCFSRRNLRLHRYQYGKEPTQDRTRYDY